MVNHFTHRPLTIAGFPVRLTLRERAHLGQDLCADRLKIVPQLRDGFREGHGDNSEPGVDLDAGVCDCRHVRSAQRGRARTPWRTITSRSVYANPWMRLREDVAQMPDGRTRSTALWSASPRSACCPFSTAHGGARGPVPVRGARVLLGDADGRPARRRDPRGGRPARAGRGGRVRGGPPRRLCRSSPPRASCARPAISTSRTDCGRRRVRPIRRSSSRCAPSTSATWYGWWSARRSATR